MVGLDPKPPFGLDVDQSPHQSRARQLAERGHTCSALKVAESELAIHMTLFETNSMTASAVAEYFSKFPAPAFEEIMAIAAGSNLAAVCGFD